MSAPLLAITMGDPAGVGPETIVGAWSNPAVHAAARLVVLGHPEIIRRAVQSRGINFTVQDLGSMLPASLPSDCNVIPVLNVVESAAADVPPAKIDARGGQAAYDALVAAARLALAGEVAGLVTAPLHKEALHAAGHDYPGHTELLAELCGVSNFAMMLYLPPCAEIRSPQGLGIVHVTLHMALREVFTHLNSAAVLAKTELINGVMQRLSGAPPHIGICALNPHGGEGGLFGDEETRIIRPAVAQAAQEGLLVSGPYPADTLIARARDGEFDAVVAMYHDQGHIAIKLLAMHRAVNITLGLPIVRTSVAHGTAFDLAWKNQAETSGMVAAIEVASKLAQRK